MKRTTHLLYVIGFLMTLTTRVVGQGLCNQGGGFTITPTEGGCKPLKVNIANTVPNASDVGYLTNYNGTATQGLSFVDAVNGNYSPTYTVAGNYTILQKVVTGAGRLYHCETVKVIETAGVGFTPISCGGGKVVVTIIKSAVLDGYDRLEINWGDGNIEHWNKGESLILNHIYSNTSTSPVMIIKGLYNSGACKEGNPNRATIKFENAQLADIQLSSLDMGSNGNLSFSYKGIPGVTSQVKYSSNGGSSFTNGQSWSLGGINTFPIRQLNTDVSYVVKMSSKDGCGDDLDSRMMASMTIKGESGGGNVKLTWNKYPFKDDFLSYELYKNGELMETITSIDVITFTDTELDCEDKYAGYHIRTVLPGGGSSKSAQIGVSVDHTISKSIETASVSVTGDKVFIMADVPGKTYNLSIERAESGSEKYRRIMALTNINEYLDDNINPTEKSYCYKLSYESCGQSFPATPPICTILLQKSFSTFNWSPDQPFLEPVSKYIMIQTGSSGKVDEIEQKQGIAFTPSLGTTSDPEYTFQIKASSADGSLESLSNSIIYKRNPDVYMPTAFTPNDDYKNDELKPIAEQLKSYSFTVFNRTGEIVFHTTDQTVGWNGKVKNNLAELGWYVYKIHFEDGLNQKAEKSGTFMLLR